ncbi:alpha-mannosidase [Acidianus manzaensis]|uniref:Alpha-mannosidase n=1 Tax=Acidianus manzaensis TaxID=282676 RepID=A0A1W6JYW3_9CREN|nr:alpha-mannosidase [Acidianus manzaensis]ARM75463.1 alpha-mannosidase [Acidianus manzaensis]
MRNEKEINQRLSYVLANSFNNIQYLSWNNQKLHINNDKENSFLMIFDYKGSGLVKINSKPFFALDGFHNYFQLPKGDLEITIEMSPFRAFGEKVKIEYGTPVKFNRNDSAYLLWIYGITTLELAKESSNYLKEELLQILSETLRLAPFVTVSRDQLFLASKYWNNFPSYLLDFSEGMDQKEGNEDFTEALNYLRDKISELGPKIGSVYAIAHAHMDTAWLWNFDETRRKVARTFSTVLELMDKYNFTYMQSMALYYDWIKQDYPELFEKIKEKINEGKWLLGAGWVEFDANVPSGESLARQLLYSQEFYLENFGKTAEILWLPDTFGFSAQLPQLMKLSGIKTFATHKVFWNDTNKFPYSLFNWIGTDGTKIPSIAFGNGDGGYNSTFTVHSILEQWNNWKDKDQPMLYSYGYGDGGGGPTEEMLIRSKVIDEFPYLPKINYGFPKISPKNDWYGELYLETHRGVLTSHSKMKYLHRRAEFSLREAEIWSSIAGNYDEEKIKSLWKILLKDEFHDVLPGSAINDVYKTVYPELQYIVDESKKITKESIRKILGEGENCYVFNSLSWDREDYIVVNEKMEGSQKVDQGYLIRVKVPSIGYSSCIPETDGEVKVNGLEIENEYLKISLNSEGEIISLIDKENNREIMMEEGNKLVFYENIPGWADAWDIESSFKETSFELKAYKYEVIENGPLRAGVRFHYKFRNSEIIQEVYVYAKSRRIDFRIITTIPDRELLLKEWFNFNLNVTEATFEIPYGVIKRQTIKNTSWDQARFEVPMQKWLDISEDDYGVGILNNGKYGVSVENGKVGISISKTPIYPDYETDKETNETIISIYPHKGNWKDAKVYRKAYELNSPLIVEKGKALDKSKSFVKVNKDNIIIESIKKSEDNQGIIVRAYNILNSKGKAEIELWFSPRSAISTDILELNDVKRVIDTINNKIIFNYSNYEIITLKIT